jgi:biotin carboxyl carrier protein
MRLTVELGGQTRTVEVARANGRMTCSIDGTALDADAIEITPGMYSILIDGQSFEARVAPEPGRLSIQVAQQEYSVKIQDARSWPGKRGGGSAFQGRQQVVAPMPGKIVRVLAKAGERIEAGQGLVVVEAMKMQNEVRSPKSGQVERILVGEGQSVNAGEVLAVVA